jgi:hypothetical protein
MNIKISVVTVCFFSFFSISKVFSQKDTIGKQSVTIVSAYKPVLMNVSKINFSASNLNLTGAAKDKLSYNIPDQPLVYSYSPITIKPLAYEEDSINNDGYHYWIKAGFGNNITPLLSAGAYIRKDKDYLVNLYGNYISSKGSIENQQFSKFNFKSTASYFLTNHEAYASAELSQRNFFLYGYDHQLYKFNKSDIEQQFNEFDLKLGIRNTNENKFKINYDPSLQFNYFNAKDMASEIGFRFDATAERRINHFFNIKATAFFDATSVRLKNSQYGNYSNNISQFSPSLVYETSVYKLNGGVNAIWNNGDLVCLPNLYGELYLNNFPFIFQGGFVSKINKNTYRNLSVINPYLSALNKQTNTLETEYYGGIISNISKRIVASAKAGVVSYKNYQFFINDTSANSDGKSFLLSNDEKINNFRIHGDITYTLPGKLVASGAITFNGFTGMKTNEKAWHTLPMEGRASARWTPTKKLLIKSELYFFGGGHYLEKNNQTGSLKGGIDLSLGSEYKINNKINAFLDLNNIFGNKYQRWHNYPVYGIGVLAGITMRF